MARQFDTTHWTVIAAAADRESLEARAALVTLCSTYWHPVYVFIRRSGQDEEAARDLTQAFFALVLEKNYFGDAKRERGRFRTFLLTAVAHFLSNERDRERALKRGAGVEVLPLDTDDGERSYTVEPVDDVTPERLFERRWAHTVLGEAVSRLRREYERTQKRDWFDRLKPLLTSQAPGAYAQLAAEFGATEGSLRVMVHRMRRQFRTVLRETVAETVRHLDDVDGELRYLLAALGR